MWVRSEVVVVTVAWFWCGGGSVLLCLFGGFFNELLW